MLNKDMTRRNFAGVLGAGMATVMLSSLTGCGSSEGATGSKEQDYDIIIVGAGGSGAAAAVYAAENGQKVAVLDRNSQQMGSSTLALGTFYGAGTVMQKEQGIEDSTDALYEYFLSCGGDKVDEDMNKFCADHFGETIDWLREDLNVPFKGIKANGTDGVFRGHMCENNARDALQPVTDLSISNGAEYIFDTTVSALIIDDATQGVVGVLATDGEGNEIQYNAKKTIIAAGGFAQNQDMLEEYCPDFAQCPVEVGVGLDGSMLSAGLEKGASYAGNGGVNGILCTLNDHSLNAIRQTDAMWVAADGNRFASEKRDWHDVFYAVCKLPDMMFYQIQDQAMIDAKDEAYQEKIQKSIDSDITVVADSLEDLAAAYGVDADALRASIDTYNDGIASGSDALEKDLEGCLAIEEGPFYITPMSVTIHGTFGGFKVNTDFQVLNENDEVIENLYAVGEGACGTFIYIEYPAGGCGLEFAYTSGRFAGKNAAEALA